MRVLMLGWEFPPFFAGGVGVVCESLTRALAQQGHDITYVMPMAPKHANAQHLNLMVANRDAGHIRIEGIESLLFPYASPVEYTTAWDQEQGQDAATPSTLYGPNLLDEIARFSARTSWLVKERKLDFDVIHAHDWTTFPAGERLQRETGKPLVSHVHITEFDKSGGEHADSRVYAIERAGMHAAKRVVAVSQFTKQRCVQQYHCPADKVRVVYNAIEPAPALPRPQRRARSPKTVLFLGRMTLQKGPDHFLKAARRVVDVDPNVRFIMAGAGDMLHRMMEEAAAYGLGGNVLFTGFVNREEVRRLYALADAFVMPSISEPFGIVPLEAMSQSVPTIVSRQSGVAEVLAHALKVDFWDPEDLASKLLSVLHYPALHQSLATQGAREVGEMTWARTASATTHLYEELAAETRLTC